MRQGHRQPPSQVISVSRERGVAIVQIIRIVAALLILLIIMLPIGLAAKAQASLTSCSSRLHLVALAMQMYRSDNDGPFTWREDEATGPYSHWSALQPYLPAKTVHCPDPRIVPNMGKDFFDYRRWTLPPEADLESVPKSSGHFAAPNPGNRVRLLLEPHRWAGRPALSRRESAGWEIPIRARRRINESDFESADRDLVL